jgi:hypothetical protein
MKKGLIKYQPLKPLTMRNYLITLQIYVNVGPVDNENLTK